MNTMRTMKMFAIATMLVLASMVNASAATAWAPDKTSYAVGESGTMLVSIDSSDFPEGQELVDIYLPLGGQMVYLPSVSLAALDGLANYPLDTHVFSATEVEGVMFLDPDTGTLLLYAGFCTKLENGVLNVYSGMLSGMDYEQGYEAGYTAGLAAGGDTTAAYNEGVAAGKEAAQYSENGLKLVHRWEDEGSTSSGLTKVSEGHFTAPINQTVYIAAKLQYADGTVPAAGQKVVKSTSYNGQAAEQQFMTLSGDPNGFEWTSKQSGPITIDYCIYCTTDTGVKPLVFQVQYK